MRVMKLPVTSGSQVGVNEAPGSLFEAQNHESMVSTAYLSRLDAPNRGCREAVVVEKRGGLGTNN